MEVAIYFCLEISPSLSKTWESSGEKHTGYWTQMKNNIVLKEA